MFVTVLFNIFLFGVGLFASWRLIDACKTGSVKYQTSRFELTRNPKTFWIVNVGYVALVVGAIYGVAVSFGFQGL